jgi:hypothetical protein
LREKDSTIKALRSRLDRAVTTIKKYNPRYKVDNLEEEEVKEEKPKKKGKTLRAAPHVEGQHHHLRTGSEWEVAGYHYKKGKGDRRYKCVVDDCPAFADMEKRVKAYKSNTYTPATFVPHGVHTHQRPEPFKKKQKEEEHEMIKPKRQRNV